MRHGISVVSDAVLNKGRISRIGAVCTAAATAAAHHGVDNCAVDVDPGHLLPSRESGRDAACGEEKERDDEGNAFEARSGPGHVLTR